MYKIVYLMKLNEYNQVLMCLLSIMHSGGHIWFMQMKLLVDPNEQINTRNDFYILINPYFDVLQEGIGK